MISLMAMGKILWLGEMKTAKNGSPYRSMLIAGGGDSPPVMVTAFGAEVGKAEFGRTAFAEGEPVFSVRERDGQREVGITMMAQHFVMSGMHPDRPAKSGMRPDRPAKSKMRLDLPAKPDDRGFPNDKIPDDFGGAVASPAPREWCDMGELASALDGIANLFLGVTAKSDSAKAARIAQVLLKAKRAESKASLKGSLGAANGIAIRHNRKGGRSPEFVSAMGKLQDFMRTRR